MRAVQLAEAMKGMSHKPKRPTPFASDAEAATAGLANMTAFVPGVGDAAGLLADAVMYRDNPKQRTWKNFGVTALGALPFVPGAAHAIFAGPLAKTADITALERAKGMVRVGVPDDEIWRKTGWWVNTPDGVPRFEIDDSVSEIETAASGINWDMGHGFKMRDFLHHEPAYAAYPDAQNIASTGKLDIWQQKPSGFYAPSQLGPGVDVGGNPAIVQHPEMINVKAPNMTEAKSVALHEMQHAVQHREGMARGGMPGESEFSDVMPEIENIREMRSKIGIDPWAIQNRIAGGYHVGTDELEKLKAWEILRAREDELIANRASPFDAYRRQAGEAEARAVQSRRDMTIPQRRATPPWQSYDVPLNELIIRK